MIPTYRLPPVASIDGVELAGPGPGSARDDSLCVRFRDLDGRPCELRLCRADAVRLSHDLVRLLALTGSPMPTRESLGMAG